jgi:hypothetical protein
MGCIDCHALESTHHDVYLPSLPCVVAYIVPKVTVGTQAAVLAGLDITMFIEFNPPHNDEWVGDHFPAW